ncbi:hypothetical protein [Duganella sp. S19_KUP01_CR8]|uniref:hypothetical protein n=1 Tax=Duganella sp. S19_KUP01_CR8 TaxID=3025502 RepID=UPI002FCD7F07
MKTSLHLLLEDYLGLMREEGELDVYLPLLMSAKGHEIVYRAQKGPRQFGADVVTVGRDADGRKTLFIWLIKRGNLGRPDWDTGPQSIRQSMNEVGDTYLRTHIAPQHVRLPKKLLVVTNGDFNQTLAQTFSTYFPGWSASNKMEVETVNGSTLAIWTEHSLLDENILPPSSRALFRRMLANVSTPELSIDVGRQLFNELLAAAKAPAKSEPAQEKQRLVAVRGVRIALHVLEVWGQSEQNQLAAYRLAEYALLCFWGGLHEEIAKNSKLAVEFGELSFQLTRIAEAYHEGMQAYYRTQDALAYIRHDPLLVSETAFCELGRLGLQGCIWAFHAASADLPVADAMAGVYMNRVIALLESHSCTQLPAYDRHSADIHVALLLLLIGRRMDSARQWVDQMVQRLGPAAQSGKYWPLVARFEDALAIRWGYQDMNDDFISTSTLLPILLLWTAVLGMTPAYRHLREVIVPAVPKTTLNFWSSDAGYDDAIADPRTLHEQGIGEAIASIPADPADFLRTMAEPLRGTKSIETLAWYESRLVFLPLLAALHWGLQIPREMLVKHAVALASDVVVDNATPVSLRKRRE